MAHEESNKRGILNRARSPVVCSMSAINFCESLIFPLFSVTQTLILVIYERTCKLPDETQLELKNPGL